MCDRLFTYESPVNEHFFKTLDPNHEVDHEELHSDTAIMEAVVRDRQGRPAMKSGRVEKAMVLPKVRERGARTA